MSEKEILIAQLEQAFDHKSWHGTNLLGSIRGVKPDLAAWRPADVRHNIWEIIVHAAYWKYSVLRRLVESGKGSFALSGSNWFPRPVETTPAALKSDIGILKNYHRELIAAVLKIGPMKIDRVPEGSKTTFRDLIIGVAAHDVYHAGQIQLIKRLHVGT